MEQVGHQHFAAGYFDRFSVIDWGHKSAMCNWTIHKVHSILMAPAITYFIYLLPRFKQGEPAKNQHAVRTTLHNESVSSLLKI